MSAGGTDDFLRSLGSLEGGRLPLAEAALALARRARPDLDVEPYRQHVALVAREIGDAARAGAGDLAAAVAALRSVIFERHGYRGDDLTYDDLDNADFARVIDRRKGLPVALGILAIDGARAQGWEMAGLAFPGHFLVRLEAGGERAILDPFHGGRTCGAAELRRLLGGTDPSQRLAPELYAPVSDRAVLLRLQNNIKQRLLQRGEFAGALEVLNGMLLIAPMELPLWYEAGLLNAEVGNLGAAGAALERFLAAGGPDRERSRAALLLQRMRRQLN